ncbi:MAG: DUF4185 domain-containing protein [Egibacteraceae bacterium]
MSRTAGTPGFFRAGGLAVLAALLLAACAAPGPSATTATSAAVRPEEVCPGVNAPRLAGAQPSPQLNSQFTAYGNRSTNSDWSGADGTYSVRLPDGRMLWSFGDTILGPVNADGSRTNGVKWVKNSFVVQRGAQLSTIYTDSDPPTGVVNPPGDPEQRWYWPVGMTVSDSTLNVVYVQIRQAPGNFGFNGEKNVLVRLSLPDFRVLSTSDVPSGKPHLHYGAWIQRDGGYTYVYGVEDIPGGSGQLTRKYMHIARVQGTDLRGSWEFYTNPGWSADAAKSARVLEGVANGYSVTKLDRVYMLLTHDSTTGFSDKIVALFSCTPTGPFVGKTVVYQTPESGQSGSYHDPDIYTYNARVHPGLSSSDGRRVVVSYNVNSFAGIPGDVYKDVSIYRPRFVDLDFSGR